MEQKVIKIVATVMAMFTLSAMSVGAAEVTAFSDVPKEFWGYRTIMDMTAAGIFKGTEEPINGVGVFSPDKIMNRAEFITASLRAIFPEEAKEIVVDSSKWWAGYYVFALDKGIVKINEFDGGDLEKPMTREEMAMIMVRCVEKNGESLSKRVSTSQIPDYSKISEYFKDYVRDCFSFGLLCGIDEAGTFAPAKSLTRAEAATVVCRLLDKDARVQVKFPSSSGGSGNLGGSGDTSGSEDVEDLPESDDTVKLPWEESGRLPADYTYAEFEALDENLKDAFIQSFGNEAAFNAWLGVVQGGTSDVEKLPWENGGKQPSEYTFAEFEALPDTQKDAFIQSFGSDEAFSAWASGAEGGGSEKLPWENGGKQPSEYTFDEFIGLPDNQKEAFIQSFGSNEAFSAWASGAEGGTSDVEKLPWENGGKKPSDYTMAEFEALPDAQKDAFIQSFGSTDAFNSWMSGATGGGSVKLPWEDGGKQPSEYTMAEFEALTDAQKEAFVNSFDTSDGFDNWLNSSQPQ